MKLSLSPSEVDLLLTCVTDESLVDKLRSSLVGAEPDLTTRECGMKSKVIIELTRAERDSMLDNIGDRIAQLGIGEDNEINSYGMLLDDLVDKLT